MQSIEKKLTVFSIKELKKKGNPIENQLKKINYGKETWSKQITPVTPEQTDNIHTESLGVGLYCYIKRQEK